MLPIPSRLSLSPPNSSKIFFGTIRYSGPVGSTGDWLGVEWDDSSRGKHDGIHEGTQYFFCSVKGSGSFIRPNAKGLNFGISFVEAVRGKYCQDVVEQQEKKEGGNQFYQSSGNFEIEVVLKSQKGKGRELEALREIGLENEGVNCAGSEVELSKLASELLNLRILNLSFSLISCWSEILAILQTLKHTLETLSLSSNRLNPISAGLELDLTSFSSLTSLFLNSTHLDWSEVCILAPGLSSLEELQLGFNNISRLSTLLEPSSFSNLIILNLEGNALTSWKEVDLALGHLNSLETLILNSNQLDIIEISANSFHPLRRLEISNNLISNWSSIDSLDNLNLTQLSLSGNPFCSTLDLSDQTIRAAIISRIGSLAMLENTLIPPGERAEAERIGLVNTNGSIPVIPPGRLAYLNSIHVSLSTASAPIPAPKQIRSKLITLSITLPPPLNPSHLTIEVLPTLSTRQLRLKLSKLLNPISTLKKSEWKFIGYLSTDHQETDCESLRLEKEELRELKFEIPLEEEGRELSYWGLMDGDRLELVGSAK